MKLKKIALVAFALAAVVWVALPGAGSASTFLQSRRRD
jgi:hypothetical protein